MNIQIHNVHFTYPGNVQALRGIDLTIPSGEIIAWIGENGAGKTTMAKLVNGLLKPTAGQVLVGERDTQTASTASLARLVGYAFQNPDEQLFLNSVWKEVAFGPGNILDDPDEVTRRTRAALELTQLSHKAEMHPYDLLPSERKLLGLASILSMQSPVMILDEPTMGLDYCGLQIMSNIILRAREARRTIVLISHDMDFCLEHAERFIVFSGGRILRAGSAAAVFDDVHLLDQAGLEEPQIVRLAKASGYTPIPKDPAEFVATYLERR